MYISKILGHKEVSKIFTTVFCESSQNISTKFHDIDTNLDIQIYTHA